MAGAAACTAPVRPTTMLLLLARRGIGIARLLPGAGRDGCATAWAGWGATSPLQCAGSSQERRACAAGVADKEAHARFRSEKMVPTLAGRARPFVGALAATNPPSLVNPMNPRRRHTPVADADGQSSSQHSRCSNHTARTRPRAALEATKKHWSSQALPPPPAHRVHLAWKMQPPAGQLLHRAALHPHRLPRQARRPRNNRYALPFFALSTTAATTAQLATRDGSAAGPTPHAGSVAALGSSTAALSRTWAQRARQLTAPWALHGRLLMTAPLAAPATQPRPAARLGPGRGRGRLLKSR